VQESPHPFLPFARPQLCDAAVAEVVACLRSGWLASGPLVARFERALAAHFGGRQVLALSSATAGLHVALCALDLQPGDEVITTPLTFVATANTIVAAGGVPVFVDVDPGTRNLDPDRVLRALSARTRAIVPVHFAGLPVDLDPLHELAAQRGLRVIEDAAHALGAEYKGRPIGSWGDTQVFSFHPNKNITTGEGGCIVTGDSALAQRAAALRFHGIDRAGGAPDFYDVGEPGFKYNMMDLQAALGLHQLPLLGAFAARRAALARRYLEALGDQAGWWLPQPAPFAHFQAWNLFTLVLAPGSLPRSRFIEQMRKREIGVGVHYGPVHLFRYYRERFGHRPGDFPVAEELGANLVTLPLFPALQEADVDRVASAVRELLA
jgi:dTDP-4-amino-4,6-dideoxygalactose transaminase